LTTCRVFDKHSLGKRIMNKKFSICYKKKL
jgi:hypothetical protein